jgi:membrane protein
MTKAQADRGRQASKPRELGRHGWRDVTKRVRAEINDDNLGVLAAGVAFYAFLALVPTLGAVVSLYGLVASAADVEHHVALLGAALPEEARTIISTELHRLASDSGTALGWRTGLSLAVAFWIAGNGVKSLMAALNVAYDERERRKTLRLQALALALTIGAVVAVVVSLALIAVVPPLLDRFGLGAAIQLLRWPVLALWMLAGLAVVYRYGPSRDKPQWKWVTPGSLLATALLLVVSAGFSLYVTRFGNYDKTYGSLGAVAVLLVWLYLGAYVILVGAEINAESEHQTARDTTAGAPEPMGQRGAYVADTVGETPP